MRQAFAAGDAPEAEGLSGYCGVRARRAHLQQFVSVGDPPRLRLAGIESWVFDAVASPSGPSGRDPAW